MAQAIEHTRDEEARFAHPLVGTVDPLGNLEVAGPIPAEEMGLRPRRRVHLVGTAYDPETVGSAYVLRGAEPRMLLRGGGMTQGGKASGGRASKPGAYQGRTTIRVAARGDVTRVLYRMHEPELACRRVALVTSVERRGVPAWFKWPAAGLLCALVACAGIVLGWHDPHAVRGYYRGKTLDEIRADLDDEVAWDSMEISVAESMVVAEGETTVEARLENVAANHCDQRVRIFESDDPADVLYESGAIAPGEYVQAIDLAHPITPGSHRVTVEFQGYEREATLVSNEGVPLGHDTFGASCAAEVTIYCIPRDAQEA